MQIKQMRAVAKKIKELEEKIGLEKSVPELREALENLKKDYAEQVELDKEFIKLKK